MGVTCQILINSPKGGGVHMAGRPVAGTVKYTIDKPTEYQKVDLWFLGRGKCSWKENIGTSVTSYYGSEDYITRHVNVTNKKPNETITLHGAYEYPFEFYLPEDIPTSHKDATSSITCKIQLKFVKANWFSFRKIFSAKVLVCGSATTGGTGGPIVFGLERTLFTLSGRTSVNLKAEIAKTCLTPGERVHLTYKVTNDTGLTIPSVKTSLYCYTTYTANCGHTKNKDVKVRLCKTKLPGVPERNIGVFTCVLPTLAELYSIQHSKVVKREYRVRTTVRLPLPHANASVEMPVALGEWRASGDEQPPSYREAMTDMSEKSANCQEKKKE